MPSRRTVLAATALGLSSIAGCLQRGGDGDTQVGDALTALPEPLGIEDPVVAGASDSDLAAAREATGPLTEREDELGEAARNFEDGIEGISLEDVDRVAGVGAFELESSATFLSAVIEGRYDADVLTGLVEEGAPELEASEYGGFTWYDVSETDQETGVFAISDRRIVFAAVQAVDVGASELAGHVIDATTEEARPIERLDDSLSATWGDVSGHTNATATSVDPDLLESQLEPPEELVGLDAVGVGTTPRAGGVALEAVLRFRSAEAADAGAVAAMFEEQIATDADDPLVDAIEIEGADGPVVSASADLEGEAYENSEVASLLALPLPGVYGAFFLGFGSASASGTGSSRAVAAPQVAWEIESLEDGRVEITHSGGDSVQRPLEISYRDREDTYRGERWDPEESIQAGSTYTTDAVPASGTDLRIVWRHDGESQILGEYSVP